MHVRNFSNAPRTAWAVFLLTFVLVASSRAQSTFGSIVGTVQDVTEAVVPGAAVTLHSEDDNSDRVTTSGPTGDFQFVNLKPGRYSVASRVTGFADAKVTAFDLAPRQTARVNVVMTLQSQQTVEVSASATMISTDKATLDSSKDNAAIVQLPLNSRASTSSPLSSPLSYQTYSRIIRETLLWLVRQRTWSTTRSMVFRLRISSTMAR
ncbi:carboxypeptidase-like regulatory domain-containing protein [Tunturiibacter gelidiferens]|uniref:carboxypeptidase-like regulatory domain-containing protein n=1 Tax=Tunturiibacter gelidiferens TaxID=3069689 RepID=UPI003D9AEE42